MGIPSDSSVDRIEIYSKVVTVYIVCCQFRQRHLS